MVLGGVEHVVGRVVLNKPGAGCESVELGVLAGIDHAGGVALHAKEHDARTRSLGCLGGAKPDGAAAAVGVHEHVSVAQVHAFDRDAVEQLGLLGVRLVERGGGDVERAAEELVAQGLLAADDARLAPEDGVGHAAVDVLGHADDPLVDGEDAVEEFLGMRKVALRGHDREHERVGLPAGAQHGVAQKARVRVFAVGGDAQALRQLGDGVEDAARALGLHGARGDADDVVRAALEEAAAHGTVLAGGKGGRRLVTEGAGRRVLAGIAQGGAHAADGADFDLRLLAEFRKELLHGSLFTRELLFVGEIQPLAAAAIVHDRAGARCVAALIRGGGSGRVRASRLAAGGRGGAFAAVFVWGAGGRLLCSGSARATVLTRSIRALACTFAVGVASGGGGALCRGVLPRRLLLTFALGGLGRLARFSRCLCEGATCPALCARLCHAQLRT